MTTGLWPVGLASKGGAHSLFESMALANILCLQLSLHHGTPTVCPHPLHASGTPENARFFSCCSRDRALAASSACEEEEVIQIAAATQGPAPDICPGISQSRSVIGQLSLNGGEGQSKCGAQNYGGVAVGQCAKEQ